MAKVEAELRLYTRNHALRSRRKELGLTQEYIAKAIGIHPLKYCYIENLKAWPDENRREDIAKVLGRSPDEMFPAELERIVRPKFMAHKEVVEAEKIEQFYLKHSQILLPAAPDQILVQMDLENLMSHLPEREREIVERYNDGETLDEIGFVIGLTRERVRQIRERALQRLRDLSTSTEAPMKSTLPVAG